MKRFASILFLFFMVKLSAQINLVPNPSFEDTVHCPTSTGQIYNASDWMNPSTSLGSTPDYFNSCNSGSVSVPVNAAGYQTARTGNAYAGFYAFNKDFPNAYEYIETMLSDTLKKDTTYCVSLYMNLVDLAAYCTNNIGVYFSNALTTTTTNIILVTPQLINTQYNLTDKTSWTKVEWLYTASGGERYMTIGNFNSTFTSDTIYVGGSWDFASYYYIDDIFVGTCDTTKTTSVIPNIFTPNNDGINDYWEVDHLPVNTEIRLFDRWGIKVADAEPGTDGIYKWDGRTTNGAKCNDGTYYYIITTIDKTYKGFLQLIR